MMKEKFIEIFKENIKRDGADKLLDYLENKSDFFTAPASTQFHGSYNGGLVEHSVNVYNQLLNHSEAPTETIAIVSLLHDMCKIGCYETSSRNVKNEQTGQWEKQPFFKFNDPMPYGHGEKSVYIISSFMKLTREEAFAIRYHMGFASTDDARNVGKAFEMFPLAFYLHVSDCEATYYLEK